MAKKVVALRFILCIISYILLIFHAEIVFTGAKDGVLLCINTLVPTLFPFLLLGSLTTSAAKGLHMPFLRPLCRLCGISKGAEAIFLVGILGGYPSGAQAVAECYRSGTITKTQATHLLRFCNNAGPSFIFGIIGAILHDIRLCFVIWGIHISSAVITGYLFADKMPPSVNNKVHNNFSIVKALESSVKTMGKICGWVIIFRIILAFLDSNISLKLDSGTTALLAGLLELSNGCIRLSGLPAMQSFFLSGFMLSFGGICVWMQTASLVSSIGFTSFCVGKCVQSLVSILLCCLVSPLLFSVQVLLPVLAAVALLFLTLCMKKSSSIIQINRV